MPMILKTKSLSLLVCSCDNYADLWPIFIHTFNKFFPEFSGEKKILSNFKSLDYDGFSTINVGEDLSWSSNLLIALDNITTDYVLLTFDDLFLNKKVDHSKFKKILVDFFELNGNSIKMIVGPKSNIKTESKYFNELPRGILYRSTAVLTIWKLDILKDLLVASENAWEFEEYSAIRSEDYSGFYVVNTDVFSTLHSVVKGKILRRILSDLDILMPSWRDYSDRKIQNQKEAIYQFLKDLRHSIFNILIPPKLRRIVKNRFK